MRPARSYSLYGLSLTSQWPLPCPEETHPNPAQVELLEELGSLWSQEAAGQPEQRNWAQYTRLQDGVEYLRWRGLFEFLISGDGRRIAGYALDHASPEVLQTYLLGQVLSHALIKQGFEPLHSTVVVINGEAVGFMGDSGYGKSTLAAALLQAGHSLLTDDMLVVKEKPHGFWAYPGLPRIKLFPEIAKSLLEEGVTGIPMNNLTPKLIVPLDGKRVYRSAVALKAMYVLRAPGPVVRSGGRVTIRRLSQRRAFLALLRNTYNRDVIEAERLMRQFTLATRVTSTVPIKLLSYPRALTSLPAVCEAILSDLTR